MGGPDTVAETRGNEPCVTVLMAVHNGEEYLGPAMDSVLGQTYADFEFLVVDDGSTDATPELLAACGDKRVRVLRNQANLGLAASLNRGLDAARGSYIARMDGDDICRPDRLAEQVRFMDAHPETVVLGTEMVLFGPDGEVEYWRPKSDAHVKAHLLFAPPFAHPSVMLRKAFLDDRALRYDESLATAQDYDLWERLLTQPEARSANLAGEFLRYRTHGKSISGTRLKEQRQAADTIRERALFPLVPNRTEEETALHHQISTLRFECSKDFVTRAGQWLERLALADKTGTIYTDEGVRYVAGRLWFELCHHAAPQGLGVLAAYFGSPLSKGFRPSLERRLRFAAKCFLGRFTSGRKAR